MVAVVVNSRNCDDGQPADSVSNDSNKHRQIQPEKVQNTDTSDGDDAEVMP